MHTLPNFLIIGAAKAGTTSLWESLAANDSIFFPQAKEPGTLAYNDLSTSAQRSLYERYFRRSGAAAAVGEASTIYTQREHAGKAAGQARDVLGEDLRLIYLVRHPVDRAVSHHAHMCRIGRCSRTFSEAVVEDPDLIERGRYMYQLEPWLEHFGRQNFLVLRTEDLRSNMSKTVARVESFIGARPSGTDGSTAEEPRANTRARARIRRGLLASGPVERMLKSQTYRSLVKPMIPRAALKALSRAGSKPLPASMDALPVIEKDCELTWARCAERFDELADLIGIQGDPWAYEDSRIVQSLKRNVVVA